MELQEKKDVMTIGYKIAAVDLHQGHRVELQEYGLAEPMTVFEVYQGKPAAKDMLPAQYDLSMLPIEDVSRNDDDDASGDNDGMTLIVAPRSGARGIVIYIADDQKEVSVVDAEETQQEII